MPVILSWLCTLVFAVIAAVGWIKVLELEETLSTEVKIEESEDWPKRMTSPSQKPDATLKSSDSTTKRVLSKSPSINQAVSVISKEELQTCLNDPQVLQVISNKVQALSEGVANKRVKEELDKKRDEHLDRIYDRYDDGEDHFTNAVNVYTEEYLLEEGISIQLQQIVEDGFNTQRDILARFQAQEISEEEAKQLGRDSHEADKLAVIELLGEDGARQFGEVVRAEYSE